jgi:hypothetical protein
VVQTTSVEMQTVTEQPLDEFETDHKESLEEESSDEEKYTRRNTRASRNSLSRLTNAGNRQLLDNKLLDEDFRKIFDRTILRESYFGGHTVKHMRNVPQNEWTDKITNCSDDAQFRLRCNPIQPSDGLKPFKSIDLYEREIAQLNSEAVYLQGEDKTKMHRTKTNYLGWALSTKNPAPQTCSVHVLSNPA